MAKNYSFCFLIVIFAGICFLSMNHTEKYTAVSASSSAAEHALTASEISDDEKERYSGNVSTSESVISETVILRVSMGKNQSGVTWFLYRFCTALNQLFFTSLFLVLLFCMEFISPHQNKLCVMHCSDGKK